jgi:methionine biosynthesis protein MetW
VDGLRYARAVTVDVLRYRAQRIGFGGDTLLPRGTTYEGSRDDHSSQGRLLTWARSHPPGRALDLGCGDGTLAEALREAGHHVTGVDLSGDPAAKARVDRYVVADLDEGLPAEVTRDGAVFDVVVAADVIEHVRRPEQLLTEIHDVLGPGGRLLLSVPNFGHWYVRVRVASGRFDYDRRGILDRTHLRFFTLRSLERLLHDTGWHVVRSDATGLPFHVADRGGGGGLSARLASALGRVDQASVRARRTLFGYQLLYELEPALTPA